MERSDQELEGFLGRETGAGKRAEEGQFTLNPERAEAVVSQTQALNPHWYWIKLLQAFELGEAEESKVVIERKSLAFRATLKQESPLLEAEKILDAVRRGDFGETALGHLAAGLAGARLYSKGDLRLATPTGTISFEQQWTIATSERTPASQLVLELKTHWGWISGLTQRAPLASELSSRCVYYPRKLSLDGKAPTRDWPFYKALLAEMYVGGGRLCFRRPELESYETLGEDLYLYKEGPLQKRAVVPGSCCTLIARDVSSPGFRRLLALTNHPQSSHCLVRHGVVVESITLGAKLGHMDRMNLGVKGVSDCSHLKTDASGLWLVRDDQFLEFQRGFLEDALELNRALGENVDITRAAAARKATPGAAWMGAAMRVFHTLGASALAPKITQTREKSLKTLLDEL